MQRIGCLSEKLYSFENLLSAYRSACRGDDRKIKSAEFFFGLEYNISDLKADLEAGRWKPGRYKRFRIHDPKERLITSAPFQDRVVHHALINCLEPVYEKRFYFHSYATRKGKGTHRAVLAAQKFLRAEEFYFKSDIQKYFETVDSSILLRILCRKIKDAGILKLTEQILYHENDQGRGMPIGNLTSQFLANVYLNELDVFIKEKLRIRHYIRYMDDFVLFDEKMKLREAAKLIEEFIESELRLKLNKKSTFFNKRENGLSFLGKRIYPAVIRIRQENLKRSIRKLKLRKYEFENNVISEERFASSLNSFLGSMLYFQKNKSQILRRVYDFNSLGQ